MKKSVYSLVLLDELVEKIDKLAYAGGISRSAMINRILAEHISMPTPEKRRQGVFVELARLIGRDDDFRLHGSASDSLLAIKSSLRFKYNPTIRYSVALYGEIGALFGELRVVLRTQNAELIAELNGFFSLWSAIEARILPQPIHAEIGDGKYVRGLAVPSGVVTESRLGDAAARYIRLFHTALTQYFACLPDTNLAARQISALYLKYSDSGAPII